MRRTQLAGLLAVLALLVGALVVRAHGGGSAATADASAGTRAGTGAGTAGRANLAPLRAAAALRPCPGGLGPAFPAVRLPCLDGGAPVRLSARGTGRPVLVNAWATWCGPCVQEVPELVAYAAKARGRVDVVGVLTTDEPRDALEFARQFGMHYPNLDDQDGVVRRRYSSGLPTTLLVDPQGRVVFVRRTAFRSVAEIERVVADKLGVPG